MALSALVALALSLAGPAGQAEAGGPTLTRPPELVEGFDPVWAPDALAPGEEAAVSLRLTLDARGEVSRVEITESVSPALDWAALGAATRFRFLPAEFDGEPGPAQVDFTLRFARPEAASLPAPGPAGERQAEADPAPAATARVSGVVRRAGTMRPVIGAEVALLPVDEEAGAPSPVTFTGDEGRFSAAVPPGAYVVDVRALDYQPARVAVRLRGEERAQLQIALYPTLAGEFESVVRGRRDDGAVSRTTLSRDEVRGIPGTFGDPVRVLESLPGVARVPFFGGALIVRGGLPGSSAIFFDGVPIPVLYHFGAFASVVNGSFLRSIDFEAGGFGPRYGRATAAVVNIESHELRFEAFEGSMDVDFMDTGFFFGGPVEVGRLPRMDFAVAARRSYLEGPIAAGMQAAAALGYPIPFLPVPVYSDFQATAEMRPLPKNRLRLFVFGAEDHFTLLGDETAQLDEEVGVEGFSFTDLLNQALGSNFWRAVGEWELRPLPGIRHTLRPFLGTTQKGVLSNGVVVQAFTGLPLVPPETSFDWGVRDELAVDLFPWLKLVAGLDHVGRTVGLELGEPFVSAEASCSAAEAEAGLCDPDAALQGYDLDGALVSTALYASLSLGPIGGLSIYPGVRAETSTLAFTDRTGTISYPSGGGPQAAHWTSVDPRVSLRFEPFEGFALKGAFGTYRRPPRAEAVLMNVADKPLDAPRATHLIAGFEARLLESLHLDSQVYGIRRDLLVRDQSKLFGLPTGVFPTFIAQPGAFDSRGRGQTLGFEVLLRHQPTRWFFGWVAYTFSRTWLDVGEELDPYHPAPFDSTHNLVLVGRLNLWWGFTLGGRFQYATGAPSPVHDSITVLHNLEYGTYTAVPSTLRRPRLPAYHRLDVRLDKRWVFDAFSVVTYAEVLNVYNYPNVEVAIPGGDFRGRGVQPLVPSVPLFPSVGLAADF